jgi:hypothetical protein
VSSTRRLLTSTDLLAGAASAGLLLVLVLRTGLDLWWSLGLGIVTYVGVRLLLPPGSGGVGELSEDEAFRRGRTLVTGLQTLARQRQLSQGASADADPVARIAALAGKVLDAIAERPARRRLAAWYLREYLTPIHGVVTRYAHLRARGVTTDGGALTATEAETFPKIERLLAELHDRLYQDDVVDLQVQSELLDIRDALPPEVAR